MDAGKKKTGRGAARGGGKGVKPRKAAADDVGFDLGDNLPLPPAKVGFDGATSAFVTKRRPSILDMKKKKKAKPKAKKPAEGSRISGTSTAVADISPTVSAATSMVTKHSEAASFTPGPASSNRAEQGGSKSVDKAHEPTQEKQHTEGGRDQSHTTQSHPTGTITAQAGPGGDTGSTRQNPTIFWVYAVSVFVIVVLTGVAVLLMVMIWRKQSKKSAVGTTSSAPPPALGLVLSA